MESMHSKQSLDTADSSQIYNYRTSPASGHASAVGQLLTSAERRQYNKALKAMYEIVKLGARQTDVSCSERETEPCSEVSETSSGEEEVTAEVPVSRSTSHLSPKRGFTFHDDKYLQESPTEQNIRKVHAELQQISKKLQRENTLLQERERKLREREKALRDADKLGETTSIVIDRLVDEEVERRTQEVAEHYESRIVELEEEVQKKTRDLKRMRASFDTIKSANDSLKKQLADVQEQNKRLETQAVSVQYRLANLQRKNELSQRHGRSSEREAAQQAELQRNTKTHKDHDTSSSRPVSSQSKVNLAGSFEVLAVLLEWVSESHLQKPPSFHRSPTGKLQEQQLDFPSALVHEKCLKILPPMAAILSYLPSVNPRVQYPCLQFTYWCIVFMEQTVQGSQRTALASTFRHIGEELFKPQSLKVSEEGFVKLPAKSEKQKAETYFHSPNLSVRLLSALIILKTLSQVDHLAHAFDVLRKDLRDDMGKQLFLTYEGVNSMLHFMKSTQKVLVGNAVDVLLQMSVDSPFLATFLDSCANEPWFRACVGLLQGKGVDVKIIEKLSIVLQRLSKPRSNRRYFDAFQIGPLVQEMLRTCDPQNAFLTLNLRSILFNLNTGKA